MPGERDPSTKPPPFDPAEFARSSERKLRYIDEQHTRETSERKLPALGARPSVVMADEEIAWLDLSEQARAVLPHIDGETTVSALMEAKLIAVDNLFDVLDELQHEGVIVFASRPR